VSVAPIETEIRAIVAEQIGAVVRIDAIAGAGVGHRRFFRVTLAADAPRTLIARVDRGEPAPGVSREPPLEPLRSFLEANGIPVPRRLGGDAERRIDLLEDLGDVSLADAAGADPAARRALYEEACDWIVRLQALADPGSGVHAFSRSLDASLFALKVVRFSTAGLRALLGRRATAAENGCVRDAFDAIEEGIADAPRRLAHRDYQSRNLLLRPGAAAGARLVWIDLQGALLAPPEYDLVCLLRDACVDLPDAECSGLAERVRPRLPDAPAADAFARRFDLLTVARTAKDFSLWHERAQLGDPNWLRLAPATIGYTRRALARVAESDARLASLADLIGARA
jgi:aminoglycoside/choline kinase family phosphotransferase